jgi:hypothetical protein
MHGPSSVSRMTLRCLVSRQNIQDPSGLQEHVVLGAFNPRGSASVVVDPRHCLGTREVNAVGSLVRAHGCAPVVERVPERAAYGVVVRPLAAALATPLVTDHRHQPDRLRIWPVRLQQARLPPPRI